MLENKCIRDGTVLPNRGVLLEARGRHPEGKAVEVRDGCRSHTRQRGFQLLMPQRRLLHSFKSDRIVHRPFRHVCLFGSGGRPPSLCHTRGSAAHSACFPPSGPGSPPANGQNSESCPVEFIPLQRLSFYMCFKGRTRRQGWWTFLVCRG